MPTQFEQRAAEPPAPDLRTPWQVYTAAGRLPVLAVSAIDAAAIAVIVLYNAGLQTGLRVKVSQRFDLQQILDHLRSRPSVDPAKAESQP